MRISAISTYKPLSIAALRIGTSLVLASAIATAAPAQAATASQATADPTVGMNANFLRQVQDCLIPAADAYGYDLYINAGYRSIADQNALYAQGRTVDGHIVTSAQGGQSMHNFGYAADLADHENGEDIDYDELGTIGAWCGLEHGDRGYTDLPHFEYRGGLSLEEFQAGMRPKPLTLPCSLLATKADAGEALTKADLSSCGAPDFDVTTTPQPSGESNSGNDD